MWWGFGDLDSNRVEYFKEGCKELQADREGDMKDDLVDYKVDPFEEAQQLYDLLDGGGDTFFSLECQNSIPNIQHNELCIIFTCLYNFRPFFFNFPFSSFVHFYSFSYMAHFDDRYSSSLRVGIVDVVIISFLHVFVFGVFSLISRELMYLEQIELL